jgi:undecaprenyl-diphosphatase
LDFLYSIDLSIFYFINKTLANPVFDKVLVLLRTQECWFIAYAILIYFLATKFKTPGRLLILTIALAIIFSDQFNSHFLKELVGRIRPCHSLPDVHLLVPCGGGKSFPSSHAVNNFTLAAILAYFFPQYKYHFYTLATLIVFSQVYVGVHYPSDVLAGALLGFAIGNLFVLIHKKLILKMFKITDKPK